MNTSAVGTSAVGSIPATAVTPDKRAQLQAMLLKKSVDMQRVETEAIIREAEGKGQSIDIRC